MPTPKPSDAFAAASHPSKSMFICHSRSTSAKLASSIVNFFVLSPRVLTRCILASSVQKHYIYMHCNQAAAMQLLLHKEPLLAQNLIRGHDFLTAEPKGSAVEKNKQRRVAIKYLLIRCKQTGVSLQDMLCHLYQLYLPLN